MAINFFRSILGRDKTGTTQSGSRPAESSPIDVAPLIYPPEMRGDTSRPCILFSAHERKLSGEVHRHAIWFPAPGGILFGDTGEYGQTDLGLTAGAIDTVSGRSGVGNILSQKKAVVNFLKKYCNTLDICASSYKYQSKPNS